MHIEAGWACCAVSSAFLILLLVCCCAVRSQRAHGKTERRGEKNVVTCLFASNFFSQLWKVSGIKLPTRPTSIRATSVLERNQHSCMTGEIDKDPADEGTLYDSRRSLGWMNASLWVVVVCWWWENPFFLVRFTTDHLFLHDLISIEVFFFAPRTKCFCLRRGFLAFTES